MSDENEVTEMWRDYRHEMQDRRAARLVPRTAEIVALKDLGFDVKALSAYHFRINGQLDLFPVNRRFHDLRTQRRGRYMQARDVVVRLCRQEAPQ